MRKRSLFLMLSMLIFSLPLTGVRAQSGTTTLTLAVPDFQRELFNTQLLKGFEDTHSGVKVRVVSGAQSVIPAANNIDKHLSQLESYVALGDLVYVDADILSPEAVNAGYFLDLNPVIRSDKTVNEEDFPSAVWKAFQWDNGFWALPVGVSPLILTYDPEAFDRAGLAYPNEKWTLSDLLDAAQKLTLRDSSGKVTTPGIELFPGLSGRALLGALLGGGLYDATVSPNAPHLRTPEAEKLLATWYDLDSKGVIGNELGKAPISVGPTFALSVNIDATKQPRKGSLLPGGKAGLDVQGFVVTAGTQYPSLAYELANYLSKRPEISRLFGGVPARRSTANTPITPSEDGGPMIVMGGPSSSPETKALSDQAVTVGIGLADLRYTDYLVVAYQKMKDTKGNALTALGEQETNAVQNQKKALEKKGKTVITVATPPPAAQPGKLTLNFGLVSFMRPIPYQDQWEKLLREFASTDPDVGDVNLQTDMGELAQVARKNDCFYLPYNAVPGADLKNILNLDPYLSVDKAFNAADLVGNLYTQVQRDGKTWALPINIDPTVLKYNAELFANAGVPIPSGTWTLTEFIDALKQLKSSATGASYEPNSPGGQYLLMLIAAAGGLPIDYRTDPPTVDLTSPATVDAIRQILDLVRSGYIKYDAIGNVGSVMMIGKPPTVPITGAGPGGIRMMMGEPDGKDPYVPVLYPNGTRYRPMSYGVGTAYISATSQNPDACYRLISLIAQHPELFSTMPAQRSVINAPATTTLLGKETISLYKQIDTLLSDPNTIAFPSMFQGGQSQAGFLLEHWVFAAFDDYILKGVDLNIALSKADQFIKGFQTCIAQLPAFDASSAKSAAEYQKDYMNCAVKVDPSLKGFAETVTR